MKTYLKKMIPMMVLGVAFATSFATETTVADASAVIIEQDGQEMSSDMKAAIDWTKGDESNVVAIGIGVPNPNVSPVQSRVLARRAAIVDAQRNLLEMIEGVQIDSETVLEDMMVSSDVVKTKISGLVKGARILDEGRNADGSYVVKLGLPLYGATGSVSSAVMPEVVKDMTTEAVPQVTETVLAPQAVTQIREIRYTGVVVDASGLGLKPTFSPVIYDTNGRIIYGIKNLNKEAAISQGVVSYAKELDEASHGNRAGNNPLVVKAVAVRGGANSTNTVNVVVSVEDADRILLANEATHMLEASAVVFVK